MTIFEIYTACMTGFVFWVSWQMWQIRKDCKEMQFRITRKMLSLLDESEQWKIIAEALAPEPHKSAIKKMNAPPEPEKP